MAKKKVQKRATPAHIHKKSMMITWIVLGALVFGLLVGFMFAKAKYMYHIEQISIMFSQRDSKLNEMKSQMDKIKAEEQKQVEF
ncbi:MAG: hypothetical protein KBD46_02355 [Candidatus Levybacteria bacterium]|nr:hypothetical protein [Candidatus Levybacteria bacterium]